MSFDIQITDKDLPVLSVIATQAIELLNRPNATNQQLNDLIRQDPALASRVLHIANSPFYGGRCQANKISEAVTRLGHRQLRNVLLVAATGEVFDVRDPLIRSVWDHTLAVANVSDRLASELSLPQAEEAFIAGLMHDVGKLIIYCQHPEPYRAVMAKAADRGMRLHAMEDQELKFFNHMSVGGLVIRKWKLPDSSAEIARMHHQIEHELPGEMENLNLACVVALANVLVNNHGLGMTICAPEAVGELPCAKKLKLEGTRLHKFNESIRDLCAAQEEASVQTV